MEEPTTPVVGADRGRPLRVVSDLRVGDVFDFVGIGNVGTEDFPDVERTITITGCSVSGNLHYALTADGRDTKGPHSTPYGRALLLIEQGIWKARKP